MKKILFFVCLFTVMVFAQDADQLLKNVKERFEGIKDFSAEIRQEGSNQVFNGKLYYKQTDKFRLELKDMIIVSDGSTVWNFNKKDNRLVIDEVDNAASFPFSFEKILNEYAPKSNLSSSIDGNLRVLSFTPKPGTNLNFSSARLWINKDNLVKRISVNNGSESITLRLTEYKLNQDQPDSRFTFKAPEGSRVIDLR
jgi:outer membrane lipoprotein-sorting protein